MLYIVATPIGNLGDITYRAVETLKQVDIIACEDTRTSGVLLAHYDIKKPLVSYHSHSGKAKVEKIMQYLQQGKQVALISDAGTPGISDPGYVLVQEAIAQNIAVIPIPGVTAFTTALMGSGMQMNHFLYLGFLPVKKGRQTLFSSLVERKSKKVSNDTVVIYESVHRIERTLGDIETYFGSEHQIVIGRELTKKFETFYRGTVVEVKTMFSKNGSEKKGEFVVIF